MRLFKWTGQRVTPGGKKIHLYVGQFELDGQQPVEWKTCEDKSGATRTVAVFRLRPVGEVSPLVNGSGGQARCKIVSVERVKTRDYPISPRERAKAERREAELTDQYQVWLAAQCHEFARLQIQPPGEKEPLYTDIYDLTAQELYEAKGMARRNDIRFALGQLLDYRRHVVDVVVAKMVVLLPERPSQDLVSLVTSCGMSCVYATSATTFERIDS